MEVEEWALDPLFSSHRYVFIETIQNYIEAEEKEGRYEFYLCKRPVRKVAISGTIVELRQKNTHDGNIKVIFKVDDGTGVIECWKYDNCGADSNSSAMIALGGLVLGYGMLCLHNMKFIIQVSMMELSNDVNAESIHSVQKMMLFNTVYSQPFSNNIRCGKSPAHEKHENGHRNPFSCSCALRVADEEKVVFVQNKFLYCACMSKFNMHDPTGFVRMFMLHFLCNEVCQNGVASPSSLSMDDMFISIEHIMQNKRLVVSWLQDCVSLQNQEANSPLENVQFKTVYDRYDSIQIEEIIQSLLHCLSDEGLIAFKPLGSSEHMSKNCNLFLPVRIDHVLGDMFVKPAIQSLLETNEMDASQLRLSTHSRDCKFYIQTMLSEKLSTARIPSWRLTYCLQSFVKP